MLTLEIHELRLPEGRFVRTASPVPGCARSDLPPLPRGGSPLWMRSLVLILCLGFLGWFPVATAATTTQIELWLSADQAKPGETVTAALQLKMAPKWHSYWKFSGDSGEGTRIQWELPAGWEAGEMEWPIPEKLVVADLTTYVHHGEILLLTPLKIPLNAAVGEVVVKGKVVWQECEEVCIRGKKEVEARLRIGDSTQLSARAPRIESARLKVPRSDPRLPLSASLRTGAAPDTRILTIQWADSAPAGGFDFFPYPDQGIEVGGATDQLKDGLPAGTAAIRKTLTLSDGKVPPRIRGVAAWGSMEGREVELDLIHPGVDASPMGAAATPGGEGLGKDQAGAKPAAPRSLWWMLIFAFVGGLILNFMPCVLPVIALKVLSFVNQSKESPHRTKSLGLLYGVGVLVSFLTLSLFAIGVQSTGGLASWGMALQNQVFRAVLTVVVTLVALNLFGVFEVTLHGGVMGAASQLTSKEGFGGAFFNGVLATVLATPCTAPFLGAALAFAFTQPAAITCLLFLTAGAGFASPFVLLCWNPAWIRWLPKPGVWMLRFKVAMGFPMLATAVWLFWFTAPRYGKSGVLWFGLFLVVVAMTAWIIGEFVQKSGKNKAFAGVAALALFLGGYAGLMEGQLQWRKSPERQVVNSLKEGPDGIDWQPWSPEAVQAARDKGVPVLVDFTADNCLNCQVNKKTSLEIESTRAKLREIGAVALLGDFTDEDPRIAAELQRYQRAGVPLVLVYPKNKANPPIVLPVLLTPAIVLDALKRASDT